MDWVCSRCGRQNFDTAKLCATCGAPLEAGAPVGGPGPGMPPASPYAAPAYGTAPGPNPYAAPRAAPASPAANQNPFSYYGKAFKNYAKFAGRAHRAEYWYFVLFNFLISLAIGIVSGIMKVPALQSLYTLATLVPSLAIGVRRMHDVGKSGWYLLIPIYNLVLACTAGEPRPNAYGPNPLE